MPTHRQSIILNNVYLSVEPRDPLQSISQKNLFYLFIIYLLLQSIL